MLRDMTESTYGCKIGEKKDSLMKVQVVILYELLPFDDVKAYKLIVAARTRRRGKRVGGKYIFLLPAKYDTFSNDFQPDVSQEAYCVDDDRYYQSVEEFVCKTFGCSPKETELLKIKNKDLCD